jgi:D-arabinose 1-dehydrogenase-like Zn-dependent alcohol dehydrogenase
MAEGAIRTEPLVSHRLPVSTVGETFGKVFRHGYVAAKLPLIPGHELAGMIERIEGSFPGLSEGARVAAAPNIPCGRCSYCRDGQQTACDSPQTIGFRRGGGFAQLLAALAAAEGKTGMKIFVSPVAAGS